MDGDSLQSIDFGLDLDPQQAVAVALRHRAFGKGLAGHLVRDAAESEDLEQETWLAALERPPRSRAALRAWLSSTLQRVRGKRARTDVRRRVREEATALREPSPSTHDIVVRIELEQRVVSAVKDLAEPYRTAILLRFYEGLTSREIATRLRVSDTAVRARLWRGVQRLRVALDEAHGGQRCGWRPALLVACGIDLGAVPAPGGTDPSGASSTPLEGSSVMSMSVFGAAAFAACAATAIWFATTDRATPPPAMSAVAAAAIADSELRLAAAPESHVVPPDARRTVVDATEHMATEEAPDAQAAEHAAGSLRFHVVDATSGAPVPMCTVRFLNDARYGEHPSGEAEVRLSAMTWDVAVRARGYEPVILHGVVVHPERTTDLGEIRVLPGRGIIEGVLYGTEWSARSAPVRVALHGSVPAPAADGRNVAYVPLLAVIRERTQAAFEQGIVEVEGSALPGLLLEASVETLGPDQGECSAVQQAIVGGNGGGFRFEGLPGGTYVISISDREAGVHVHRAVLLAAGGHERLSFTTPGTTDLELVVLDEGGVPFDVDHVTEQPGFVGVEVLLAQRTIGFAFFEPAGESLADEMFEMSAGMEFRAAVIDRARREGDALLPPLLVPEPSQDFAGARERGNAYPLAQLPREELVLRVTTPRGNAQASVDLRSGSPGRIVVQVAADTGDGR